MPLPHAPAKTFVKGPQSVWSGLCCIQTDDTLERTLVPSEPASARPMSEVQFTPRTPTGPPPPLRFDQMLEFERRLQSSIVLVMEQQYERLSGEVLEILQCSQQKTELWKSSHSSGKRTVSKAADALRPLRKLGKSTLGAAQVTMNDSPNPPLLSPRSAKCAPSSNGNCEHPEKFQKAEMCKHVGPKNSCPQLGIYEINDDMGRMDTGQDGLDTVALTVSPAAYGEDKTDRAKSTIGGRIKATSTLRDDNTVLADLVHAENMRQREKKVQANMKSKFKSPDRDSLTGELIQHPMAFWILHNPLFDSCCASAIVINAVLIGVSVEWLTTHDEETFLLIFLGHMCNLFFLFELTFRLCVYRVSYFTNEDWRWNCFDFALVSFSVIDFVMWLILGNSGAGSVGSTLKIVKMLRIVRIVRVFRFFRELSLLALLIMDSLRSLVWTIVMLAIIIYIFAIGFTQNATEFLKSLDENSISPMDAEIDRLFGSLPKTIYSLVYSMLGGVSWGEVSDPLMHMDAFSATLFFFYICFTVLAVLNIITGVFVDNAVETAKVEREFLLQKEMELREKLLSEMRQLFAEMDEDKSGSVNLQELHAYLDEERVQTYFHALGLDPTDAERLFRLSDADDSGEVQVAEFLDGCLRLKGEARSIDVNTILWQCKQIQAKLDRMEGDMLEEDRPEGDSNGFS